MDNSILKLTGGSWDYTKNYFYIDSPIYVYRKDYHRRNMSLRLTLVLLKT